MDVADVEIISENIPGWLVANEGAITVALDVTITEQLRREGIARDIINRLQNIRKERDFDITDRINLVFAPGEEIDAVLAEYSDYIASQVLAQAIATEPIAAEAEGLEHLDIDGLLIDVIVTKA